MQLTVDPEHLGTSELEWLRARELAACARFDFGAPGRAVVIAPHPDDEVLALGGTMQRLADAGWSLRIVAVTDGEGSHPRSRTVSARAMAERRMIERDTALHRLGISGSSVVRLGLHDGSVGAHVALDEVIEPLVSGAALCFAPWERDGHPDHDAAGLATKVACERAGVRLAAYPVWAWHWAKPGTNDLPWSRMRRIDLDPGTRLAKRAAIAAYRSQIAPIGPDRADETILPPSVLERFHRSFEVVFA